METIASRGASRGIRDLLTGDFKLLFLSSLLYMAGLYLLVPVLPLYMVDTTSTGDTGVGLMIGTLVLVSMALRPLIGRLTDHLGRRPVMAGGSLSLVGGSLMLLASRSVASITAVMALLGVSVACFHTASVTFAGDIAPDEQRGQAMAWFQASFNIAIMLAPLAGMYMRDLKGYPPVFRFAAVVSAASFLAVLLVAESPGHAPRETARVSLGRYRRLLALCCVAAFCGTVTLGAAEAFIALFTEERSIPHYALFFTISGAVLIALRLFAGRAPDRFSRKRVIVFSLVTLGVSMLLLAAARGFSMFCVAALVYGIGFSFHAPTIAALLVDRTGAHELGSAMGVYLAAFEGGIAFGSILMGPVTSALGFGYSFMVIGLVCFAGAAFVALYRRGFTVETA